MTCTLTSLIPACPHYYDSTLYRLTIKDMVYEYCTDDILDYVDMDLVPSILPL